MNFVLMTYHVTSQYDLLDSSSFEVSIQGGTGESMPLEKSEGFYIGENFASEVNNAKRY